jgi:hypothetical protein
MRVGQKNKLTYRWARKGSRPRAVHDQRTQSTYGKWCHVVSLVSWPDRFHRPCMSRFCSHPSVVRIAAMRR